MSLKEILKQAYDQIFADNEEGLITEASLRKFVEDNNNTYLGKDEVPELEYIPADANNTIGFWAGLLGQVGKLGKTTFGLALDRLATAKASLAGAAFTGAISIKKISGIDSAHLQFWNPNITGRVNQEQRAEIYLRDNADFEFRNVTGARHVFRSGDFTRELFTIDDAGNIKALGSVTANGVLLGQPGTPEGVEWLIKPETPTITDTTITVAAGQLNKTVDNVTTLLDVPAATLPFTYSATGKKRSLAIVASLNQPYSWALLSGPEVPNMGNLIFPVISEAYAALTYIEIGDNSAFIADAKPVKVVQLPGTSTADVLSQKAVADNYHPKNAPTTILDNSIAVTKMDLATQNKIQNGNDLVLAFELDPDFTNVSGWLPVYGAITSVTVAAYNPTDTSAVADTAFTFQYKLSAGATNLAAANVTALQAGIATTSTTQRTLIRVLLAASVTIPVICLLTIKRSA